MVKNFKINIYSDGADVSSINKLNKLKFIDGFTTNPSLMRKSKVKNYKKFALDVLKNVKKNQFLLKFLQMIFLRWKNKQR